MRRARRAARATSCGSAPSDPALKVPHMGWNRRRPARRRSDARRARRRRARLLRPHAITRSPDDPALDRARGRARRAVLAPRSASDNVFACQFHPEKSQARRARAAAQLRRGRVKLFPAIDLLGGQAVRLEEGKRERATVFHDEPVELVAELAREARIGCTSSISTARSASRASSRPGRARSSRASPIPVEVGGGIRDRAGDRGVLALGAAYVVLGTAAVRSPALVEEACRAHPGRDHRRGRCARRRRRGRRLDRRAAASPRSSSARARPAGAPPRCSTPTSRATACASARTSRRPRSSPRAVSCEVIASGGVGSLDDLARAARRRHRRGRRRPRALRQAFTVAEAAARRARSRRDARAADHPVPRRQGRPRRQGHQLRRSCATPAIRSSRRPRTTRRAPTRSASSTSPRRPRAARRSSTSSRRTADQVFTPLTVGGGVRTRRRCRAPARRRRRQDRDQHRRDPRPRSSSPRARARSAARRSSSRSTRSARGAAAGRSSATAAARRRASTRSRGAARSPSCGAGEILAHQHGPRRHRQGLRPRAHRARSPPRSRSR